MNKQQWSISGFIFMILMVWFISQDVTWENLCKVDGDKPLDSLYQLRCIQVEIFDPFIYTFFGLWMLCWINAWLESKKK
jgi:hypothetical protein